MAQKRIQGGVLVVPSLLLRIFLKFARGFEEKNPETPHLKNFWIRPCNGTIIWGRGIKEGTLHAVITIKMPFLFFNLPQAQ